MISFGARKPTSKSIAAIRKWVEDALPPELEEVVVMVNEMNCLEPGCAPVETVITLLEPQKPRSFKIFKPADEVQPQEVLAHLQQLLAGSAVPEHRAGSGS